MGNEGLTVHLCSFPCSLRGGMPGIDRYQPTVPCQRCIVQSVRGRTHSCSSSGKINAFGQQEGNSWCHPNHPSLLHRTLKKNHLAAQGQSPGFKPQRRSRGVALLTACSLRALVYTGEEQNPGMSLRACTHTHAQARVQTVGMHTHDTELGMESCRRT